MEAPGWSWKKVPVALSWAPGDVLSEEVVMSLCWESCSAGLLASGAAGLPVSSLGHVQSHLA